MTRIKICGLMNRRDINLCVRAGVHMLGFVVDYPIPVAWNLTPVKAGELIGQVPPFVGTCIVTGGSCAKVLTLANKTHPNVVQLHHQETLAEVQEIARQLKTQGIKTIKALRIDSNGKCDFEISDPATAARALAKTGIAAILVDAYTNAMPGGTGVRVDLATFSTIQKESSLTAILAGGLNPNNILPVIHEVHPFAVDVLTGVENKPGEKDPEKIERFMQSMQADEGMFLWNCSGTDPPANL